MILYEFIVFRVLLCCLITKNILKKKNRHIISNLGELKSLLASSRNESLLKLKMDLKEKGKKTQIMERTNDGKCKSIGKN